MDYFIKAPGGGKIKISKPRDDATFTFRINSNLKNDFAQLCQFKNEVPSNALKQYMRQCIEKQKIL